MKMRMFLTAIVLAAVLILTSLWTPAYAWEDTVWTTPLNDFLTRVHITADVQAQQGQKGGEGTQLVYDMDISPHQTDTMLLGNNTTGIWRSDDGGNTWSHSAEGLKAPVVVSVRFDPDVPGTVYAVAGIMSEPAYRLKYHKIGLYKSVDNGKTWQFKLPLSTLARYSSVIAFGAQQDDQTRAIYIGATQAAQYDAAAAGATGVFVSYDRGESWTCIGLAEYSIYGLYADTDGAFLIAATDAGVFVTTDGGQTWISKNDGLPASVVTSVTVNPENPSQWFVGTQSAAGPRLSESLDAGGSWTWTSAPFSKSEMAYLAFLTMKQPTGCTQPRLFAQFYSMNNPGRYSDDYGRTFIPSKFDLENTFGVVDSHNGWFPTPYTFLPGNDDVVFSSRVTPFVSHDGGETFVFSASGYTGMAAYDWTFDTEGKLEYMAIADLGVVRFDRQQPGIFSNAQTIRRRDGLLAYEDGSASTAVAVDPHDSQHAFATLGGAIYGKSAVVVETTDGFATMNYVSDIYTAVTEADTILINKLLQYHPQVDNVLYTSWFVSEDNGQSWRKSQKEIRAVSPFNGDVLYALENYTLYISRDRGDTWTDTGLHVWQSGEYRAFSPDLFNDGVVWVADDSRIYRMDTTIGYTTVINGLEQSVAGDAGGEVEINTIAQNPRNRNHFLISTRDFISCGSAVYESYDSGQHWEKLDVLSDLTYASSIEFHPTQDVIFIGSMMGTFLYEYRKNPLWYGKNTEFSYDAAKQSLQIWGTRGAAGAYYPVKAEIISAEGTAVGHYTAQVNCDHTGTFRFDGISVPADSGAYLLRVSTFDASDDIYVGWFSAGSSTAIAAVNDAAAAFDIRSDETLYMAAEVGRLADTFDNVTLIAAFYDEADRLIQVVFDATDLAVSDEAFFTLEADVPDGAAKAKCFLWKDMENLIPIAVRICA